VSSVGAVCEQPTTVIEIAATFETADPSAAVKVNESGPR
jgi:hypothetical protein